MNFKKEENWNLKKMLEERETQVISQRDSGGSLKHDRDQLRSENVTLKQKSGLIGHDSLLRDYEKKVVGVLELMEISSTDFSRMNSNMQNNS